MDQCEGKNNVLSNLAANEIRYGTNSCEAWWSVVIDFTHFYPRLLLRHCFEQLRSTQVAVVHCSAQTSPMHVLQKLQQSCMVISSNTGRVYRPKDCERLVLYLKDLNLPKPDKWGTSQLIAFLQQVENWFRWLRFFYSSYNKAGATEPTRNESETFCVSGRVWYPKVWIHYMKIVLFTRVLRSCVVFTKSNMAFNVLWWNDACSSSGKTACGCTRCDLKRTLIFKATRNTIFCLFSV